MAYSAAVAAIVGAGAAVYSATKPVPKPPAPPQEAKAPTADAFRNRNQGAQAGPRGDYSGSTLLTGGVGGAGLAKSTLLGQ